MGRGYRSPAAVVRGYVVCMDDGHAFVPTGLERAGMVVGGLVALIVTPSFSRAYFSAYGYSIGEQPPPWLASDWWPVLLPGSNRVDTYNRHGVVFGIAMLVAAVSFGLYLRRTVAPGTGVRRAWRITVFALLAVAIGSILEYGLGNLVDPGYGFGLELIGFLAIVVGTIRLAIALRREQEMPLPALVLVALSGLIVVIAGMLLVGHIPSGPASLMLVFLIVVGVNGLPSSVRGQSTLGAESAGGVA